MCFSFRKLFAACVFAACFVSLASAQTFPNRPITILNQYEAGGGADLQGRVLAEQMSKFLGQPVVLVNKPGAAGMIAANAFQSSEPDGYTLLIDNLQLLNNPMMRTVTYDYQSFKSISRFSVTPVVMLVSTNIPVNTVAEFVKYAKERPRDVRFGALGPGGTSHLGAKLLEKVAGIEMQEVPYKGTAAIHVDMIRGEIHAFFDGMAQAMPQFRSGKLKVLAVATDKRVEANSDIPTFVEQGYQVLYSGWFGLSAPNGTPQAIINRLNEAVRFAVASNEFQTKMKEWGVLPVAGSPEEFEAFKTAEREKWGAILKPLNLKLD